MLNWVGRIVGGRYAVVRPIGRGSFGDVYLAEHMTLGCPVALKALRADAIVSDEDAERFIREATACASITSDHVVRVLDLGRAASGEPFLVMEYLDGESLAARLSREKRLPASEVASFAEQVLAGLDAAHGKGIVHRDVKPSNIFFANHRGGERVKLLDFGICKLLDAANDPTTTIPGTIIGTAAYMAPEQERGGPLDARCDLFALAVVLFEASTGCSPYAARGSRDVAQEIAMHGAGARSEAPLDPQLAAIVARALAPDPDERYASASEMRDDIVALADDRRLDIDGAVSSARVRARRNGREESTLRDRAG